MAEIQKKEIITAVESSPEDGGFSDLMENPILKAQFGALVDNFVEQGNGTYDSLATYRKAGETIRTIGNTLDPDYTPPVIEKKADGFESKREKKSKIINIKTVDAKAKTDTTDDDKEESTADVIAGMKKQRGQG